jgi:predicted nucleotidyltransferase
MATIAHQISADPTLQAFLNLISGIRSQILRLTLFGSRARGDSRLDSDYDMLLVVNDKTPALEDKLYDAVLETLLTTGKLVSLKIFTKSEYERLNGLSTPFLQRINEEGVQLG